jgi:outer membrane protein assembly factor BamB
MRFRAFIHTLAVCLLIVCVPLLLPVAAGADAGDVLWERTFHEGNDFATSVASHGGRVFAGGFTQLESADDVNVVRAFSARTGRLLWARRAAKMDSEAVLLTVTGHVVVAGLGRSIQAYDAHTGAVVWTDDPGGSVSAIAAGHQLVVAVGTRLGSGVSRLVRAYNPSSGELLWEDVSDAPEDRESAFAVAVAGGRVFVVGQRTDAVGRGTFRIRAYRARTGRLIWEDSGPGDGAGPAATSAGFAVASHAGVVAMAGARDLNPFIRAWEARTGEPLWQHEVPQAPGLPTNGFFDAADVQGRRLIVGGSRGGFLVQALDLWTGALDWEQRSRAEFGAALSVTHARRVVVATGIDDRNWLVQAYDARSGRLLWEDRFTGPGGVAIARDDEPTHGRVFVVGEVNQGDPDAADAVVRAYDLR